jgi:hypothetical protein
MIQSSRSRRGRSFVVLVGLVVTVVACTASEDPGLDDEQGAANEADDEEVGQTEEAVTAGPCAGTAIDRAVKCAKAKGARVLSYYRSPADQERVRRENHCRDRCAANSIGCVRPTAGCNSSPHTRCKAVDLVADGAPASRAALRACGLGKTTAPHANHYDLVN